jgi:hypothetical protein
MTSLNFFDMAGKLKFSTNAAAISDDDESEGYQLTAAK